MKNLKYLIAAALCVFLLNNTNAQNEPHHPHHQMRTHKIEEFKADLNLTAEQEVSIKEIRAKYREQRKELNAADFEDRHEFHEQMRELTHAQSEEIKQVLNEEQREILAQKLEEKQAEHFEKRKANRESRKAMHEELETYRAENIEPAMLKQRAKLEEKISAEDKVKLEELRPVFEELHERKMKKNEELSNAEKPMSKEERHALHDEHKKVKEEHKAEFKTLNGLMEKYEKDIEALMTELEDERTVWREEMREIKAKYKEEAGPQGENHQMHGGKEKHHREMGDHKLKGDKMRKGHFLLLDPNETPSSISGTNIKSAKISPNPSVNFNTVSFELLNEGQVTVELKSERGATLEVLFDGFKEAGIHKLDVDLKNRNSGVYYISIQSGKDVKSEKFILTK